MVDEAQAAQIRVVYTAYLNGRSFTDAAKEAGLKMHHGSVKRMLQNRHYLGDAYYPAIIDGKTFDAALAEQQKRAKALGRIHAPKKAEKSQPTVQFSIGRVIRKYEGPFQQAEYAYGLIECEVRKNGRE